MYKVSMLLIENSPDRSEPDQHKNKQPERKMNERSDKLSVNSHKRWQFLNDLALMHQALLL